MNLSPHLKALFDRGSSVRALFELALQFKRAGKRPINLALGSPVIKPPEAYYEALQAVIDESRASATNLHGYMPNSGFLETRTRIAEDLNAQFDLDFKAEHVFMTVGAANALDVLLKTIVEPVDYSGNQPSLPKAPDEIIVIAPYFVEYGNLIRSYHAKQVTVQANDRYGLDLAAVDRVISSRTRAIIVNSPNNPTGAVYPEEDLSALARLLADKNREFGLTIAAIEDAAYRDILFADNRFHSLLPHYPYTFFVTSFSKSLGLAGERIGFFSVHPSLAENTAEWQVLRNALTVHLRMRVVNAPSLQQRVIERIGSTVAVDVRAYESRANRLADTLELLGFELERPKGGFFVFARLPSRFEDEGEFRKMALAGDEPLVYAPGVAFGGERFDRHIRLSVCATSEDIERACSRLKEICEY